jgi:hypothetical protein
MTLPLILSDRNWSLVVGEALVGRWKRRPHADRLLGVGCRGSSSRAATACVRLRAEQGHSLGSSSRSRPVNDTAKAFCAGLPGAFVVPGDLVIVSPLQDGIRGQLGTEVITHDRLRLAALSDQPVERRGRAECQRSRYRQSASRVCNHLLRRHCAFSAHR